MKRKPYDNRQADLLEDYVRKDYWPEMTNSAKHVYFEGARYLERKGVGLCQVIVKNIHDWARASAVSYNTVTKAQINCHELGLIDYVPGQALIKGAAAQVRRRMIEELERGISKVQLKDYVPVKAKALAERLAGRRFIYGDKEICPKLVVASTGRIYMSHPCPQTDSKTTRTRKLLSELKPGEVLVEVDYRQTEPTVARRILTMENFLLKNWPADIYQELASYLGKKRNDVKGLVMAFLNAESSMAHVHKWGILQGHFFYEFGKALDSYKKRLWQRSKPKKGLRRHVYTLGGTLIEALKGDRSHKGQLFSWQVQGTVADILNPAISEILDGEREYGWRFLFQVYDSVYVATTPEYTERIENIMQARGKAFDVHLKTETKPTEPQPNYEEEVVKGSQFCDENGRFDYHNFVTERTEADD